MPHALTTSVTHLVQRYKNRRTGRATRAGMAAAFLLGALGGSCAVAQAAAGFRSNFIETRTLPGFDTPLVTHGQVQFDARGFRWEVTAPYHYLFEMHGDQAQEQLPDGQTRKLDPAQTPWLVAVKQLLASALSGNQAQLQEYFTVQTKMAPQGQHVTLTPKAGALAQAIGRIEVTESTPGHPEQLIIREAGGGRLEIRFTSIQP